MLGEYADVCAGAGVGAVLVDDGTELDAGALLELVDPLELANAGTDGSRNFWSSLVAPVSAPPTFAAAPRLVKKSSKKMSPKAARVTRLQLTAGPPNRGP